MDIRQVIKLGETSTVEFKSWEKTPKYKDMIDLLVKEVVGLANTRGGFILAGVEDDGEITGCTKFNEQSIIEAIYDKTIPKLFTDIEIIELDDKKILKIIV